MNDAELRSWLVAAVAGTCELDAQDIDAHTPLDEYGLSSRDAVELSGALEDLLDRTLPATLLWEHPSVDQLVAALTTTQAEQSEADTDQRQPPDDHASDSEDPIAIVGLGCRLPGGIEGPRRFWQLLTEGDDAIAEVPRDRWADFPSAEANVTRWGGFLDDVAGFDAEFFGIAPREAARMDPQQRMVLEVAWEALEHAGIAPAALRGSNTGVFVGVSGTEYGAQSMSDLAGVDPWMGTGAALSIAANRLSYVLDLRGPSLAVDTACSSSLSAVHLAAQSLRAGESELALVGGANLLLGPAITASFDQMGISAPDGRCKPFSADADGISRAEGTGIVVLKRLREARDDGDQVLALIRGSATNSDGRSNGLTAPNAEAQQALLRTAYDHAGIGASEVDYVEAHGTGTLLGDPIEAGALGTVLGTSRPTTRPLLVGSVKSNLGHLEAAAGIVGLIKVVLAMQHNQLPPSVHYHDPNPHIPFDELALSVVDSLRPWPQHDRPAVAGVSGFGFGGTNAHIVVQQPEPSAQPPCEPAGQVNRRRYVLGATSRQRLAEHANQLADWLAEPDTRVQLADLEHTMARRLVGQGGRFAAQASAAVTASGRHELVDRLRTLAASCDNRAPHAPFVLREAAPDPASGPVFVFSGHGSQWAGMGRTLLTEEPAFAEAIDRIDPYIRAEAGFSLRDDLQADVEAATMDHVQPLIYGMQLAMVDLWAHYGIQPSAVIGHSFGEVTAAVVAGSLTEADGARIVALRSRLLASLAGDGAMAVLEVDARQANELVAGMAGVDVAALSAPNQTVIAGSSSDVRSIVSDVDSRGLLAKLINLDVAAHSPIVDSVVPTMRDNLSGLSWSPHRIDFYSTTLDDPRRAPTFDASYWAHNLRTTVRFVDAASAAAEDGYTTFVELSPHPILRHALTDTLSTRDKPHPTVVSTLRHLADEATYFHTQLGALELAGHRVARGAGGQIIDIPTTPWRHVRHWLPAPTRTPARTDQHPLLGTHIEIPDDPRHVWRADVDAAALPWLYEHQLAGRPVLFGSAYVEMASAAARTVFEVSANRIALSALSMHQPLVLAEQTAITTTLTSTAEQTGTVNVHTKSAEGTWQLHATCTVSVVDEPAPRPRLRTIDSSGLDDVAASEVYRQLDTIGVHYGPALAGLNAVRVGTRDGRLHAIANVRSAEPVDRHAAMPIPPALLDSCLQTFAAAMVDPAIEGDTAYMPTEFGAIRVYADPSRGQQAHVSVSRPDDDSAELVGQLHLVDEEGAIVLQIDNVFLHKVAGGKLAAPLAEQLVETAWVPTDVAGTHAVPQNVLLVGYEPAPLCTAVAESLTHNGAEVRQAGDRNRPVVTDTHTGQIPESVLFLLPREGAGAEALAESERAVLAVSAIVGQLVDARATGRTTLCVATTGAAAVTDDEHPEPAFAALRGLVRVLAYEHPELRVRLVDLDAHAGPAQAAAQLVTELPHATDHATHADDEVALRANERYSRRLQWTHTDAVATAPIPVARPDGGYVISGGLGGLGLYLADWLAEHGAGKVVLNGRSEPGEHTKQLIEAIAAKGTTVDVVLGDIAEPDTANRLVATAEHGTRLRGVLHAAAVFDDRTTTRLDAQTLHRCWRPKAYGALRLHQATEQHELDWWVGFSSAAGLHGLPGQPAYGSANAYLDAVVAMRRAQGLPASAISWGTWADVGAAAQLDVPWLHSIHPEEGTEVLAATITSGHRGAGAIRLNAASLVEAFPRLARVPFFADMLGRYEPTDDTDGEWVGRAALAALPHEQARSIASAQLRSRVASVLGFARDQLDADAPLSALGVDSLLAVRIRNAVQHDFELTLPVSLLLRGASLAEAESWLFGELDIAETASATTPQQPANTPALVPPRDAVERLVTSVWQDVLEVAVGVTQNFYDIGGSTRAAEQVTAVLAERSGRELTVSELFEHPTVERMAGHLREGENQAGGPVRVLREHGDNPPLFLFHPGGGDTQVYRQLIAQLDADTPVFGFDRIEGVTSVEDRVRRYLPELRAIQPEGPYQLAGWSFGGFLAYEMAQQLRHAGARVDVLALMDPILPLPNETGLSEVQQLEKRFERFEEFLETSYGRRVTLPYERLARLDDQEQVELLISTMLEEGLVNSAVSDAILHHQRTSFLDARSLERYRPAHYDGRVVFFGAGEEVPGGLRDQRFDRMDPAKGWDAVCTDLEILTVPGHHLSMLDPPNVEEIGKHLDNVLATSRKPVGSASR